MGGLGKFIKGVLVGFLLFISAGAVIVAALIILGVSIDLSFIKGRVEAAAKLAMKRDVILDNPVTLELSTWPSINVGGIQVENAEGAKDPLFLKAGNARVQIGLLPLFKGAIDIADISAQDIVLNLENNQEGKPNWIFGDEDESIPVPLEEGPPAENNQDKQKRKTLKLSIHKMALNNISLNYYDASLAKDIDFQIKDLFCQARRGEDVFLDVNGKLQNKKYKIAFNGGPIQDLLSRDKPWQFKLNGDVFEKNIEAEGDISLRKNEPEEVLNLMSVI